MRTQLEPRTSPRGRRLVAAAVVAAILLAALCTLDAVSTGKETGLPGLVVAEAVADSARETDQTVHGPPDIDVDVASQEEVRPGGTVAYTIHYTNTTGRAVSGVRLVGALSPGQVFDGEYESDPPLPGGSYSREGLAVEWYMPTLAVGASGTVRLETQVENEPEPSAEQPIRLVGISAETSADDAGVVGDEDTAVTRVIGPILELTKWAAPSPVTAGHTLSYTLALANLDRPDSIPASGIVITDVLPEHCHFVEASPGGRYDAEVGEVEWRLDSPLAKANTVEVWFKVTVDPATPAGTSIVNDRDEYAVLADEISLDAVRGRRKVATKVAGLLEKTAEGPRFALGSAAAYPGEHITYTVRVRNYLPKALSGVRVTDTLPARPDPFEFVSTTDGRPPPEVDGTNLIWRDIDIPAQGVAEWSYVVRVPVHIAFSPNTFTGQRLRSQLAGDHPEAVFGQVGGVATVQVQPPVVVDVGVDPRETQSGQTVTYTLSVENRSSFNVPGIRITDTVRGPQFRYTGMVSGPAPEPGSAANPVVWSGLELPAGGRMELVWNARAVGTPLRTYTSELEGWSPRTSIPSRSGRARLKIASPFRIALNVTPDSAMVGDTLQYDIELTSVATSTWTLSRVEDKLPDGFYEATSGQPGVVTDFDPPFPLHPGNAWTNAYEAVVSGDVGCEGLPRRFVTRRGNFRLFFLEPEEAIFANASDLGPVNIVPHVSTNVIPHRGVVMIDHPIDYELRLENGSSETVAGIGVTVQLPDELTYVKSLSGVAPLVADGALLWSSIGLEAGAVWSSKFQVLSGHTAGARELSLVASTEGGAFCVQQHPRAGRVGVADDCGNLINLEVEPLNDSTPPSGLVDYELRLKNKVNESWSFTEVSTTLPSGFTYEGMTLGPPPEKKGSTLVWRDIELVGRGTYKLRYRTVASPLFGSYVGSAGAQSPDLWPISTESEPVNVLPLIQLGKDVHPATVAPGSTVAYTISLVNLQDKDVFGVRLTDTLPANFTYSRMISGPTPDTAGPGLTSPSWGELAIPRSGGERQLVLEVLVAPDAPHGVYYNRLEGTSPNALVPGTDDTAPVTVTLGGAPLPPTTTPPVGTPGTITSPTPARTPDGPTSTPPPRIAWLYFPHTLRGR